MCQLLGMNCNTPTDICFSFEGFHTRGGLTDVRRDGWGIAFFERAFCWLLQNLRAHFDAPPSREALFAVLRRLTFEIAAHGEFNYLLSNGDCLFAHCETKLHYIVRQAPFAVAHLKDQDVTVDFSEVTTPDDRVALVATAPLTDNEAWTTLEPGTLTMFVEGTPAA